MRVNGVCFNVERALVMLMRMASYGEVDVPVVRMTRTDCQTVRFACNQPQGQDGMSDCM